MSTPDINRQQVMSQAQQDLLCALQQQGNVRSVTVDGTQTVFSGTSEQIALLEYLRKQELLACGKLRRVWNHSLRMG